MINNQIASINFNHPENLLEFIESRSKEHEKQVESRIESLKEKLNGLINQLYDAITKKAFELDPFRIPVHGIPQPSLENPVNLFQRQIKIEQLSFDVAHNKYQEQLYQL